MSEAPLGVLVGVLIVLILLSAFFSGSETAMMSLNRYRLRHLAKAGHRGARRADRLLARPDRLIGLILLGNNFVNIFASSIATVIALQVLGEGGIALAAGLLTLVVLIFAEVAPKTLAALHPERIAFPASLVLAPALKLLYPAVWAVSALANGVLKLLCIYPKGKGTDQLTREELRTVVKEAGNLISRRHQSMLISILELDEATVEDIMISRQDVVGIDLEDPIDAIIAQLSNIQHTRVPLYRGELDDVVGFVHARSAARLLALKELDKDALVAIAREPYFVPEGTPLHTQLLNFQRQRRRIGLVVNEYGDIDGLVTLEDILEEIVGEFTTDVSATLKEVHPQEDGSYVVDGAASVRELNRNLRWHLPTDGPRTLNGLILEYLETIPEAGTSLIVAGHPIEILQTTGSSVKTVRIRPRLWRTSEH